MITDNELDQRLTDAFARLDDLPAESPGVSTSAMSADGSGSRHRGLVAAAAAVIAIAGVIGVTQLGETDAPTTADLEADPPATVSEVPVVDLADAPYRCVGFIGTQGDDRIYDDCGPMIEHVMVDYVCRGYVGTDAQGFDGLADCDAIAATSNVPGINSLPTDVQVFGPGTVVLGPSDMVPTAQVHIVQPGDWPLKVANDYCVSLQDLIAANGWDSETEFPFPGTPIAIPPGSC